MPGFLDPRIELLKPPCTPNAQTSVSLMIGGNAANMPKTRAIGAVDYAPASSNTCRSNELDVSTATYTAKTTAVDAATLSLDADLAWLVAMWPNLSEDVRTGVMKMIRGAGL